MHYFDEEYVTLMSLFVSRIFLLTFFSLESIININSFIYIFFYVDFNYWHDKKIKIIRNFKLYNVNK